MRNNINKIINRVKRELNKHIIDELSEDMLVDYVIEYREWEQIINYIEMLEKENDNLNFTLSLIKENKNLKEENKNLSNKVYKIIDVEKEIDKIEDLILESMDKIENLRG